jgi:hypothetical protein
MNSARNLNNLNNHINRLEQTLGTLPCSCADSTHLSWPGHQPDPHCPRCGGERLVYPLAHHPGPAEPLIRQALPIIKRAFGNDKRADLGKLTDQELHQLKTALQRVEQATTHKRTPMPMAKAAKP